MTLYSQLTIAPMLVAAFLASTTVARSVPVTSIEANLSSGHFIQKVHGSHKDCRSGVYTYASGPRATPRRGQGFHAHTVHDEATYLARSCDPRRDTTPRVNPINPGALQGAKPVR